MSVILYIKMNTFLLVTAIVIFLLIIPKDALRSENFFNYEKFESLIDDVKKTFKSSGSVKDQNTLTQNQEVLNDFKTSLRSFSDYKFKQSDKIAKDISKKLKIELENFRDYAPPNTITVPDYLYKNQAFKIDPAILADKQPVASNSLDNDTPVGITSEMSISWSEKTANNAHSHYFKLMDSLPRSKVPDPTQGIATKQ